MHVLARTERDALVGDVGPRATSGPSAARLLQAVFDRLPKLLLLPYPNLLV
jgi:hypothetical protein